MAWWESTFLAFAKQTQEEPLFILGMFPLSWHRFGNSLKHAFKPSHNIYGKKCFTLIQFIFFFSLCCVKGFFKHFFWQINSTEFVSFWVFLRFCFSFYDFVGVFSNNYYVYFLSIPEHMEVLNSKRDCLKHISLENSACGTFLYWKCNF